MTRTVILHYHLFKNAGTSVDQILQSNFKEAWVTREFPTNTQDNSDQVAEWILSTPEAVAYSTHTALGPVPKIPGLTILTVLMLRDPLARIRSAYRFEARQDADTWGAQLARENDFEGYVTQRLARAGDRQCRNFQTQRLASMVPSLDPGFDPGLDPELERAQAALDTISVLGLVEAFDGMTERLNSVLAPHFPGFHAQAVQANTTHETHKTEADLRTEQVLRAANAQDLALWEAARAKLTQAAAPQETSQKTPPETRQDAALTDPGHSPAPHSLKQGAAGGY